MTTRRTVDGATSDYIWLRDGGKCIYCGDYGAHVDHVLPVKWGGPTIDENLVLACKRCNMRKRGDVVVEYLVWGFQHLLSVGEDLAWTEKFQFGNAAKLNLPAPSAEMNSLKRSRIKNTVPPRVNNEPISLGNLRQAFSRTEFWQKIDEPPLKCRECGEIVKDAFTSNPYCVSCWDVRQFKGQNTMTQDINEFTFIDQSNRPQDSDVCILNRWWLVHPERGLVVYKNFSIQCNEHKDIVERLSKPWSEVRFVPIAYVPIRIING